MSLAYTPGPWQVDPAYKLAIESASNGNVGIVNLARASEADAKLLAAAPDMAEALEEFVHNMEFPFAVPDLKHCVAKARTALAKAGVL